MWCDWKQYRNVWQSYKEIGDKPWYIKRAKGALWPCYRVEGVRKGELNRTQVGGLLHNFSSVGRLCVWELCLNRRETCTLPLLTASFGPNEALIGGVGCCSLEKRRVSRTQWRWQQRLWGSGPMSFSLNCMLSNHFKSTVTEYSPKLNGKHMKGSLNAFVCRFFFFHKGD